jgi:hypothetical protein
MMTAMTVAAFLSGIHVAAQPQTPPASQSTQPPAPAQQPPVSRPPAEQMPAPTPTPTQAPAPPVAQVATPGSELDRSTANALLERIEAIVNEALLGESSKDKKDKEKDKAKDKDSKAVGTSGKLEGKLEEKAGKLTVDRAALDEILAEVALLKTMIRR